MGISDFKCHVIWKCTYTIFRIDLFEKIIEKMCGNAESNFGEKENVSIRILSPNKEYGLLDPVSPIKLLNIFDC